MRKCVSMVAVASTALGLAACSASHQAGEPAGAGQQLSTQAASGTGTGPQRAARAQGLHAGVPNAAFPAVPVASGAAGAKPGPGGKDPRPGQVARQGAAPTVPAPVLIPSGTTDVAPHPTPQAAQAAQVAAGRPAAAGALAPALPRPAPPPPPAQERRGAAANLGYDADAAASAQIMNAVAAAQMDGKAVLLDFGATWCTACKVLDNAMRTPKVQAILAQSYHVVRIDLGNADPAHLALATQYAAYGTFGMPLLVVLNPDGTVRANSALTGQPKYTEADMAAWLSQYGPR